MKTGSKFCLALLATGLPFMESFPSAFVFLFCSKTSVSNEIHDYFNGESCFLVGYRLSLYLRWFQNNVIIPPLPPSSCLILIQTLTKGRNRGCICCFWPSSLSLPSSLSCCVEGHRVHFWIDLNACWWLKSDSSCKCHILPRLWNGLCILFLVEKWLVLPPSHHLLRICCPSVVSCW